MKLTNINGRFDHAGRHNDRNFDVSTSSHIDASRADRNKYWVYNGDFSKPFIEVELDFYKEHFAQHLQEKNERYIKGRHKEKVRSMSEYIKNPRSQPEDKILQIGNRYEHPDPDELWDCALAYQEKFNEIYGDHCKILTMALHDDEPEGTPHVQIRRVWIAEDEWGNEYVCQQKALESLGVSRPDLTKPVGKRNNEKMVFTDSDKMLFYQICKERGLDVEKPAENLPPQKRLDRLDYIIRERSRELKQLEEDIEQLKELDVDLTKQIDELKKIPYVADKFARELEELEKKKKAKERARLLIKIYREIIETTSPDSDSFKATIRTLALKAEKDSAIDFIDKNGLLPEYEKHSKRKIARPGIKPKTESGI